MKENRFLQAVKHFLWPNRCVFCRKLLKSGEWVCASCEKECAPAHLRYYIFLKVQSRCFQCASPYSYVGKIRGALHRYKFRHRANYARFFGKMMAETVKEHFVPQLFSAVTFVPVSKERLKERGYDQAELLAKCLAEELGLPFVSTLEKVKHNKEQHKLKVNQRRKNALGVYRVREDVSCEMKRYLLVDDIITTGYTVSECARLLKKSGAEEVVCVSAARVL